MRNHGNNRAKTDATYIFENSTTWRKVSKAFRQRNPVCAAIEHGVQCNQWATQVHHIEDPTKRPDLRIDWKNLVPLCDRHHISGPGDAGLFQYADSLDFDGSVIKYQNIPLGPQASKRTRNALPPGKLFVATRDAAALDAALADCWRASENAFF